MADELARLGSGRGQSEPGDHVVEPRLQHSHQRLPGWLGPPNCLVEVAPELALADTVEEPDLLLLLELAQILRARTPVEAAVLAWRIWPLGQGPPAPRRTEALEVEVDLQVPGNALTRPTASHRLRRVKRIRQMPDGRPIGSPRDTRSGALPTTGQPLALATRGTETGCQSTAAVQ